MKTVTVTFDGTGNVSVETSGFKGAECQKATAEFEKLLGKKVSDTPTPEGRLGNVAARPATIGGR